MLWKRFVRPLLFCLDAERAHYFSMGLYRSVGGLPGIRSLIRRSCSRHDPRLRIERFGLTFEHPIALAAGFDKNARWVAPLGRLGFSAVEIGTVTRHAQPGNPRPRLFRLARDGALLNRRGFNNDGCRAVAERLQGERFSLRLGVNIGKSKAAPLEEAAEDYEASFRALRPAADYLTVNVSSPNTPGLRSLQDRVPLTDLLRRLSRVNAALSAESGLPPVPLLLKIAPDLTESQLDDVVEIARDTSIAGIIATNTTIDRSGLSLDPARIKALGDGGVSGRPLSVRSRQTVRYLYRALAGSLPIVGSGGVMTGEDAWELMRAGASLVQVYTGFIYGGPLFVRRLLATLQARLDERGLDSLEPIIGESAATDD